MATFKTPGVYVEEITKLPASVAQVATAIPAFIGYTENLVTEPRRITSMTQFVEVFGGPAVSIVATIGVNVTVAPNTNSAYKLYYSMLLYFGNGGGPCWIVSAGAYKVSTPKVDLADLVGATGVLDTLLVREDEPTLIYIADAVSLTSGYGTAMNAALAQSALLKDRFVIMDLATNTTIGSDASTFRSAVTSPDLKYGAAYYPWLNTSLTYPDSAVVFSGPAPLGGLTLDDAIALAAAEVSPTTPISNALSPLLAETREAVQSQLIVMPPGGAIAGVYAYVDRTKGVWHAPANIGLNLVTSATIKINDEDQQPLNVNADAGKSINAIRLFTGKGVLVWGARTLAGNDNEWRYVPVRRLFITVEESISKATEFVVFEPNDANTWVRVKGMIENYLTTLWRQGALAGAKPENAFFVKVGLGETMSAQDILDGNLIIDVGMAAVRPAEFIVLRFSHKLQVS
ncbi:MAG: phage tail sheath family protein [Bacteroidetes bacterium]|nr:phage tail sheath family protein [Bacteroidota bacterium]